MKDFLTQYGSEIAAALATLVAAVGGGAFSLRSLQKKWVGDGRDIANIQVESQVVQLLRDEWARAMLNNAALAEQITKLHTLVDELREEIAQLKAKVNL